MDNAPPANAVPSFAVAPEHVGAAPGYPFTHEDPVIILAANSPTYVLLESVAPFESSGGPRRMKWSILQAYLAAGSTPTDEVRVLKFGSLISISYLERIDTLLAPLAATPAASHEDAWPAIRRVVADSEHASLRVQDMCLREEAPPGPQAEECFFGSDLIIGHVCQRGEDMRRYTALTALTGGRLLVHSRTVHMMQGGNLMVMHQFAHGDMSQAQQILLASRADTAGVLSEWGGTFLSAAAGFPRLPLTLASFVAHKEWAARFDRGDTEALKAVLSEVLARYPLLARLVLVDGVAAEDAIMLFKSLQGALRLSSRSLDPAALLVLETALAPLSYLVRSQNLAADAEAAQGPPVAGAGAERRSAIARARVEAIVTAARAHAGGGGGAGGGGFGFNVAPCSGIAHVSDGSGPVAYRAEYVVRDGHRLQPLLQSIGSVNAQQRPGYELRVLEIAVDSGEALLRTALGTDFRLAQLPTLTVIKFCAHSLERFAAESIAQSPVMGALLPNVVEQMVGIFSQDELLKHLMAASVAKRLAPDRLVRAFCTWRRIVTGSRYPDKTLESIAQSSERTAFVTFVMGVFKTLGEDASCLETLRRNADQLALHSSEDNGGHAPAASFGRDFIASVIRHSEAVVLWTGTALVTGSGAKVPPMVASTVAYDALALSLKRKFELSASLDAHWDHSASSGAPPPSLRPRGCGDGAGAPAGAVASAGAGYLDPFTPRLAGHPGGAPRPPAAPFAPNWPKQFEARQWRSAAPAVPAQQRATLLGSRLPRSADIQIAAGIVTWGDRSFVLEPLMAQWRTLYGDSGMGLSLLPAMLTTATTEAGVVARLPERCPPAVVDNAIAWWRSGLGEAFGTNFQ